MLEEFKYNRFADVRNWLLTMNETPVSSMSTGEQ